MRFFWEVKALEARLKLFQTELPAGISKIEYSVDSWILFSFVKVLLVGDAMCVNRLHEDLAEQLF